MKTQRTVDGAPTGKPKVDTLPAVPPRSARRATARRASARRDTAHQHRPDLEGRIIECLRDRPGSTAGDLAKALNADRGTIAAGVSHLVRASEIQKDDEAE
jgi:hypothetical protein